MHPIRVARLRKGYTMAELGRLLGVAGATVHRWENGQRLPDRCYLRRIEAVLGVSRERIVRFERQMEAWAA